VQKAVSSIKAEASALADDVKEYSARAHQAELRARAAEAHAESLANIEQASSTAARTIAKEATLAESAESAARVAAEQAAAESQKAVAELKLQLEEAKAAASQAALDAEEQAGRADRAERDARDALFKAACLETRQDQNESFEMLTDVKDDEHKKPTTPKTAANGGGIRRAACPSSATPPSATLPPAKAARILSKSRGETNSMKQAVLSESAQVTMRKPRPPKSTGIQPVPSPRAVTSVGKVSKLPLVPTKPAPPPMLDAYKPSQLYAIHPRRRRHRSLLNHFQRGAPQTLPAQDERANGFWARQSENLADAVDVILERVEREEEHAQVSSVKEAALSDLYWRYRFGENQQLAMLMRPPDEARGDGRSWGRVGSRLFE
jgi:hypothetical protein